MEALAAISLAGNVIQFVEVGVKTIKIARRMYKSADGTDQDLARLEKETLAHIDNLRNSPQLTSEDEQLEKSVSASLKMSDDLIRLLRDLRLDGTRNRFVEAASKSVKAHLAKSRIKSMESGLEKIRELICGRLLFLLR
jgi:hypothetical protein